MSETRDDTWSPKDGLCPRTVEHCAKIAEKIMNKNDYKAAIRDGNSRTFDLFDVWLALKFTSEFIAAEIRKEKTNA